MPLMCMLYFVYIKLLCIRLFNIRHFHFVIFTACFQYRFDLSYRNNREVFSKQEEAGKEQPERTKIEPDFIHTWAIVSTPA